MTDVSQAIAKKQVEQKKNPTVEDYLRTYEPEFQRALGASMDAAKFTQDALTAIKQNPVIGQSDPRSLFGALFLAAQLKLPVGGPLAQFHLTTRKVRDVQTVVPIVGFQGYIQLIMNTGLYSKVGAFTVHAKDFYKEGANSERGEFFDFEAGQGDRGEVIGVLAYAKRNGINDSSFTFVDAETIRTKHRPKYWEKTPWATDEPEMFKKTGIRVLQKYLPKSVESLGVALAAEADQGIVRKIDGLPELQIQPDFEDANTVAVPSVESPVEDWATAEVPA